MMDWTPILTAVGLVLATAMTALIQQLASRALAALEARNLLNLTAADRQTVRDAMQTATGTVLLQLAKGKLAMTDERAMSDVVKTVSQEAIARVPDAAARLGGVSAASLAQVVVGAVGNAIAADPTVPTVARPPTRADERTFSPVPRPAV